MARTVAELNNDIKRLAKEIRSARKELMALNNEADDAGSAVDRAGMSFDDGREKLEGFGASMRAVGGNIGPIEDMTNAFAKLGPAGFAAAAGVAALVGATFAVVKFAQATVEATRAAGELLEEWDHPEVFSDQAVAIDEANRALDDLVTVGQMLQVLFASEMSPAVQKTVDTIMALGFAVSDAVESVTSITTSLEGLRDNVFEALGPLGDLLGAITEMAQNLTSLQSPIGVAVEGFGFLQTALGDLTDSYRDDIDAIEDQAAALRDAAKARDETAAAADRALKADEAYYGERLAQIERQEREEERAREAKAKADAKAREKALKAEEKYWEDWRLQSEKAIEAQAEAERKEAKEAQRLLDEQSAAIEKAAEREAKALADAMEVEKRGREELAAASIGLADTVLANMQDNANSETLEGQRTIKQVFGARKALALAEVAIATIVAVQRALASAPPPFNAIPAAAMGVAGAANFAAVAAQKPPSFAIGGLVPSDHQLIGAQAGEGILSTAAVRALGEEQVGAMNRGTSGGAPVEVAMVYRHRVFDRFVQDNLRRSDSPLAGAIQGARRKRKRRR